MKRLLANLAAASALALASCANLRVVEAHRERSVALTATTPGVAVMAPLAAEEARESPFLVVAMPLIWISQLIALHIPAPAPQARECLDELRAALRAQLASVGLHALDTRAVDGALATARPLREIGADYVLHSKILTWSRSYFVLHSQVTVEAGFQLVRLSDGVVVWDGTVTTRRQAGLLQLANIVSGIFSSPVAGLPVGQLSAITGPASKLRGGAYEELVRDLARATALHLTPDRRTTPYDRCICELCEGRAQEAPGITSASVVAYGDGVFRPGDALEVMALAPAGTRASFDLGELHSGIPMVEQGQVAVPGIGGNPLLATHPMAVFRGSYVVQASDASATPLRVRVRAIGVGRPTEPMELAEQPVTIASQ